MRQLGSDNSNLSFPWHFQGADTAAIWELHRKCVRTKSFAVTKGSARAEKGGDGGTRSQGQWYVWGYNSVATQIIRTQSLCCCTQTSTGVCNCWIAIVLPCNLKGKKKAMVRCFILNFPHSWPPLIFSSGVYSEGKWEWKKHCSGPVINGMSALFPFTLETTRKTCWRIFMCQYKLPMNAICKLELVALRDWSQ